MELPSCSIKSGNDSLDELFEEKMVKIEETEYEIESHIEYIITYPLLNSKSPDESLMKHACMCERRFPSDEQLLDHIMTEHWMNVEAKLHRCNDCSYFTHNKNCMYIHQKTHSPDRAFKCDRCGKIFKSAKALGHHRNLPKGRFRCNVCCKSFENKGRLRDHKTTAGIHDKLQCPLCPYSVRLPSLLERHTKKKHTKETYECDKCGKSIVGRRMFSLHRSLHHPHTKRTAVPDPNAPYICEDCHKIFSYASTLKVHQQRHHRNFTCKICYRLFPDEGSLDRHKAKPNVHPLFKCDICDHVSYRKQDLKHHSKKHLDKTVECEVCHKFFKSQKYLNRHMRCHGTKIGCQVCEKRFPDENSLAEHTESFVHEKFGCNKCSYATFKKYHLNRHTKIKHP